MPRNFLRLSLIVKNVTVNEVAFGELVRQPLIKPRYCRIRKCWLKVLEQSNNYLGKHVCLFRKHLLDGKNMKVNWTSLGRDLLFSCAFGEAWPNQIVANENCFIALFKLRVKDVFMQNGNVAFMRRKSLLIIDCFILYALYVFVCITCKIFRIDSRLYVETGSRGNQPVLYDHRCGIMVQDEYHFRWICPLYTALTSLYISKYYRSRPSMFSFK